LLGLGPKAFSFLWWRARAKERGIERRKKTIAMIESAKHAVFNLQAVWRDGRWMTPPFPFETFESEPPTPSGVFTMPVQESVPCLVAYATYAKAPVKAISRSMPKKAKKVTPPRHHTKKPANMVYKTAAPEMPSTALT